MGRVTSRTISPKGSRTAASLTFAARRAIRRQSSACTGRSRTSSCSRITTCPVISKPRSRASSSTTITYAIKPHAGRRLLRQRPDHPPGTRKNQTQHHQTATIETPLESRLNSNPQSSQSLRSNTGQIVPKHLKTDMLLVRPRELAKLGLNAFLSCS